MQDLATTPAWSLALRRDFLNYSICLLLLTSACSGYYDERSHAPQKQTLLSASVFLHKVKPISDGVQKNLNPRLTSFKRENMGAGGTAQGLSALADLPEDVSSIPSSHLAANSCL